MFCKFLISNTNGNKQLESDKNSFTNVGHFGLLAKVHFINFLLITMSLFYLQFRNTKRYFKRRRKNAYTPTAQRSLLLRFVVLSPVIIQI
jgi:hypothetical protein